MIGIQLIQLDQDLIENVDIRLANEALALAILEHLLTHHMAYIFKSLDLNLEISELETATETVGSFDAVWVEHLKTFEHLDGNHVTASALWETTVRLFVHNRAFSSWFANHSFVKWIELTIPPLCNHLSKSGAHHWMLYADWLELFLALSLLPGSPNRLKDVLKHFAPRRNLAAVYEMMLRTSTLERWIVPEHHVRPVEPPARNQSDGYEAEEEPVALEPTAPFKKSTKPVKKSVVIEELLRNFSYWQWHTADDERSALFQDFLNVFTRTAAICFHPPTATVLSNRGMLAIVLSELKPILIGHPDSSAGIRQQLLRMIISLGKQRITPGELQLHPPRCLESHPNGRISTDSHVELPQPEGYRRR